MLPHCLDSKHVVKIEKWNKNPEAKGKWLFTNAALYYYAHTTYAYLEQN